MLHLFFVPFCSAITTDVSLFSTSISYCCSCRTRKWGHIDSDRIQFYGHIIFIVYKCHTLSIIGGRKNQRDRFQFHFMALGTCTHLHWVYTVTDIVYCIQNTQLEIKSLRLKRTRERNLIPKSKRKPFQMAEQKQNN